ncbi:MAG: carbohydrate ABC transporter permease [Oscillospiraceae bacterium]|jgi:sn-glycerol 3-phosphate transport system permease protein
MKNRAKRKKSLTIFLFLLPALLLAAVFCYYPFLKTILNSFSTVNNKGVITGWAGLDNYRYTFGRSDFPIALRNTLILTFVNVPVTMAISFLLALLSYRRRKPSPVIEVLLALPMAVSMSAACLIFKSMFSKRLGIINSFFGLEIGWFEDKKTALLTVLILTVWMGISFNYMLFLGALRKIPRSLTDTTALIGIGPWTRLTKVYLPLTSQTMLYSCCINFAQAVMCSAPMIIITQGGPSKSTETLMYMMYAFGFGSADYGLAAVTSLTAFAIMMVSTVIAFAITRKKVFYR